MWLFNEICILTCRITMIFFCTHFRSILKEQKKHFLKFIASARNSVKSTASNSPILVTSRSPRIIFWYLPAYAWCLLPTYFCLLLQSSCCLLSSYNALGKNRTVSRKPVEKLVFSCLTHNLASYWTNTSI